MREHQGKYMNSIMLGKKSRYQFHTVNLQNVTNLHRRDCKMNNDKKIAPSQWYFTFFLLLFGGLCFFIHWDFLQQLLQDHRSKV